ncbi:MAG: ABC transporter permease [Candidatus Aminicenantes bacterium]|nr:ABC transporter permease [Candidatus Aminicenantes bacterium]
MVKKDIKMAVRQMTKHKGYSGINIFGLAAGLACTLFILLWVQNELSFDRFHKKARSIYRVEQDQKTSEGIFHVWDVPFVLGPALQAEIPEIKNYARSFRYLRGQLVRYGEKVFYESVVGAVDPSLFQIFSFPFIQGNADTALKQPSDMIISETMAEKYFGRENPIGKTMTLNNNYPFTVSAVLKDTPPNSTLQLHIIVPMDFLKTIGRYHEEWGSNSTTTWVEVDKTASIKAVNEKITRLVRDRRGKSAQESRQEFMLKPLLDIRLNEIFGYCQRLGSLQYVRIFSTVALFVLLIACINFMNLSTARAANRAKEVGMRKVVGASRRIVARQFYVESIVTTSMAALLSVVLVLLLLPVFNSIAGTQIEISRLFQRNYFGGILAITVGAALLSGSYPAVLLSSFHPIRVLQGKLKSGAKSALFRKALVVVQFSLSILLLISASVVFRQLNYMRTKELGYDKEHLVYMQMRGETRKKYETLKEELLKSRYVVSVTGSSLQPSRLVGDTGGGADWDGKDPDYQVILGVSFVDFDYPETMKIEMAAGRTFSREFSSDRGGTYLVNEEVVKLMGIDAEEAVGKRLDFVMDGTIVGVMKNFHLQSPREAIEPRVFLIDNSELNFVVVRLQAGNITAAVEDVKRIWQRVLPLYPFEFRFFDDDFERMYRSDERMGKILEVFTVMAFLIAGLGLFGLVSYAAEQRTKEIGIRKVLGASMTNIVTIMSKEFILWVITANLVAWPLGYLVMRKWLQGFAFRTGIAWWLFAAAGLGTLAVAFAAVGFQTIRAARTDPVKALKYE